MTNIRSADRNIRNAIQAQGKSVRSFLSDLKAPAALTLLLALSGCGGGGGGGGGGQATALNLSTSALSVSASLADTASLSGNVTATLINPPAGKSVYLGVGATENGISSLSYNNSSGAQATVSVAFKPPYTLAPAQYRDTMTFEACLDSACNDVIPGTMVAIPVTYTVSAPTGPNAPQLILGSSSLQATASPGDQSPPAMRSIAVSVSNVNSLAQFTISVSQKQPSIFQAQTQYQSSIAGQIDVSFETPTQLLPGTYTDTLTVQGCYDSACVNPIGSPQFVQLTYTISNSVGGAQGYTINVYPLSGNDLIWDSIHGVMYVSVPSSAGANGNSIVAVNPATGAVLNTVFAGSEPNTLALSDDAQFLYVALKGTNVVQRFVLPGLTPDITIPLSSDPFFGPLYAGDIKVMPGTPHTLAVARIITSGEPNGAGVQIFDDAVPRPTTTPGPGMGQTINSIVWAGSAASLLGADTSPVSAQGTIYSMTVAAAGVSIVGGTASGAGVGRMYYLGGLVYDDSGAVANPALSGNAVVAICAPSNTLFQARAEAVDGTLQSVFQLGNYGTAVMLLSYQTQTCQPIATAGMGGVSLDPYAVPRLIRWGANGLAFLTTDGKLVTLTGPFVAP